MRNNSEKIHMNQDKNNAFISVGDEVRITLKNGEVVQGTISCIDIKKEKDKLHPIMDIINIKNRDGTTYGDCFWVENMEELEIVKFKGE